MAFYGDISNKGVGYTAGADLSAEQYTFMKRGATGVIAQCNAGEASIGVLWNAPAASGRAATVITGGQPMVYAGAAVAEDAEVTPDDEGRAVTATSSDVVVGIARTAAGAANELMVVEFLSTAQYTKA